MPHRTPAEQGMNDRKWLVIILVLALGVGTIAVVTLFSFVFFDVLTRRH